MEIPDSPTHLSPAWLTQALRSHGDFRQLEVRNFAAQRIGEKEGFAGFVYRIALEYGQPVANAPQSLIAKFSPTDPVLRLALQPGNEREIRFYTEIATAGTVPVPRCYYGDFDPTTGACILLLEDLGHLRTVEFVSGCTVKDAERVLRGMASFHAHWWNDPRLETMSWLLSLRDTPYPAWWAQYPQQVAAVLPDYRLPEALLKIGDCFANDMPGTLAGIEAGPVACIHRDIHIDNILFGEAEQSFCMVDWQTVGKGRAVSDVGYFLISSLPTEVRREHESRLLRMYHDLLLQAGVRDYSFDNCWLDYRRSALAKLFITVQMTVVVDNSADHRREWRKTDLDRLTAFIADHESEQVI